MSFTGYVQLGSRDELEGTQQVNGRAGIQNEAVSPQKYLD